ncbi:MAG: branched-chain amino acid ABC transporter permease [Thermodesulfobacteriota bacterium]
MPVLAHSTAGYSWWRSHWAMLVLAAVYAVLPFVLPYKALACEIMLFSLAAAAFDLCLGYAGVMMFCQASFFGLGVYAAALTLLHLAPSLVASLFMGALAAAVLAFLVGYLATARSGSYSVLLTLAFAEMIYFIAYQWSSLTGGDNGLTGIKRPNLDFFGLWSIDLQSSQAYYYFVYFFFLVSIYIIRRITFSPFGKVLLAIRENEQRAQAIGYNTRLYKMAVFIIGGLFMGLAGALYSTYICFAHIHNVHFETSGNIVMMVLTGGMGTLFGPMLGAFIIVLASDVASALWDRWMLIMGMLFIFFVLFARGGIWGLGGKLLAAANNRRKTV